jgi:AcrR family transcriptional regulator
MSGLQDSPARRGREASERALIDAAIELFAEHGVRAVSVRSIAKLADVNHGLVHHYFGSKAGLVTAVLDELGQRLGTLVGPLRTNTDGGRFVDGSEHARVHARVLAYAILEGATSGFQTTFPIVERFTAIAHNVYGLNDETARLRSVQAAAMIFGWMMMEPWLLEAGGFDPAQANELRPRLVEGISRLAAHDAPQPFVAAPPTPSTDG